MNTDELAIAKVLAAYQDALNASNAAAALQYYAVDGVFMPQHSPSSVGIDAVRRAYAAVFANITLQVTFEIAELRQVAPTWAFARTNSAGRTTVHATGEIGAEANQELFVFEKIDDEWKIARYCFSTTLAATA